jgi:hypothetical protein
MEIFFNDPEDLPVPPEEVKIRELTAKAYPDGRRVRVYLEIAPFQKAPDAEVNILNQKEQLMASVSVIETMDPKMEMTLHLPASTSPGAYRVKARVFYREELPEADDGEAPPEPISLPEIQVVDQTETQFEID